MAKECQVCNTVNPSVAKHCSNCGSKFSDKELSAEDQLRIELSEAKKTIRGLNKSLDETNVKIEELKNNTVSTLENNVKELKKQLVAERKQNNDLTQRLNTVKKCKNRWAWLFFLSCVILMFLFGVVIPKAYSDLDNKKSRISELEYEVEQLKSENKKLANLKVDSENLNIIKQEYQKLKAENERLLIQISQSKDNQPVTSNNKNNSNNNISSNSSLYRAIIKTYFYDFENGQFIQRKAYLMANDIVNISMQISDYGYTEFVNREDKITKGWLKMSDLLKN